MKRKRLLQRGVLLLLALVLAAGCFWPALTAEASDFTIDDSGFVSVKYDHQTLYIWRRGMPEAVREEDIGYKRDLLITWDGLYYLKPSENDAFMTQMVSRYPTHNGSDSHSLNTSGIAEFMNSFGLGWIYHLVFDWSYAKHITYDNGWFPYDGTNNWNNDRYPNGYPHGYYMYVVPYGNSAGLLSSLPLNYSILDDADICGTLTKIDSLPFGAYVGRESAQYTDANGSAYTSSDNAYGIGIPYPKTGSYSSAGNSARSGVWVASDHKIHTWNDDHWYKADDQYTYVRASLDYWTAGDDETKFTPNGNHSKADSCWRIVAHDGTKKVSIETIGKGYTCKYNDDGFADNQDKDDLYHLYHGGVFGYMALAHYGSQFRTVGNANQWAYNYKYDSGHPSGRSPYLDADADLFDVYWCEPKRINYLQTPIEVANGQVTNLEGPMCNNSTITVKDGGTLTITGWCANNGTIIVEPGGTLYVQKDACLNRMAFPEQYEDHKGGTIISEGLILVGENAKLCGGGMEGIHLKDGCHVINYGLVTSENFIVDNAYTIENRQNGVVFYGSGNGILGSGMGTWANVTGPDGYKERGKYEPTCFTNLTPGSDHYVANAIYND